MRFGPAFVVLTLSALVVAAPLILTASELYSGVGHQFTIEAQSEETLLGNLTFTALPGSSKLTVEIETDNPSDDLDLYVRFALPPQQRGETIIADYASSTPASGVEMIEADAASDPPLQTGIYHIALLVKTLDVEITGTIMATAEIDEIRTTFIISTFGALGDEGWRRNYPASDLPGATLGEFGAQPVTDPGGFLRFFEGGGAVLDALVAPAKFVGDFSRFTNARFEFDFRHTSGVGAVIPVSLRLVSSAGAYRWAADALPVSGEWEHYVAELDEAEWVRVFGDESFEEVLADLRRIELSGDQSPESETDDLDNFSFSGEPPDPPSGSPDALLSSDFENGFGGWTRNYPALGIEGTSVGAVDSGLVLDAPGHESETFLKLVDSGTGSRGDDAFVPPTKFLGDLSQLDRPWFEFRYRRIEGDTPREGVKVYLIGLGTVFRWSGQRPREIWQLYRPPLNENHFVRMEGDNTFSQVLQNLARVEISGDLAKGPEANGLDNFYLREQYVAPSGRALFLDPEVLIVHGAAGDETVAVPPIRVSGTSTSVNWEALVQPESAVWLSVSPATGTTPSEVQLAIDAADLTEGVHEAEVLIRESEFRVPRAVSRVILVLAESRTRPRISEDGVVHAAAVGLPLSPGGLASVFGENFAPAEQDSDFLEGTTNLLREVLGVKVLVQNTGGGLIEQAPLLYVGPRQVNFQMPFAAAGYGTVRIVVENDEGSGEPEEVVIEPTGPGLFVFDVDRAVALNQDGPLNTAASPAEAGSIISAFLTGVGEVDPPVESGMAAPAAPLSRPIADPRATIGAVDARILAIVLAPGYVGLVQANVEVPASLPPGDHELVITVGDQLSNRGIISVE